MSCVSIGCRFLIIEIVCVILFHLFPGGKGKAPRECLGKRPEGIHIPIVNSLSRHTI